MKLTAILLYNNNGDDNGIQYRILDGIAENYDDDDDNNRQTTAAEGYYLFMQQQQRRTIVIVIERQQQQQQQQPQTPTRRGKTHFVGLGSRCVLMSFELY